MNNLFNKIKEKIQTNTFKASFWATIISLLIALPFVILLIIMLLQYSFATSIFWITIFVAVVIFTLIISFSTVVYTKLLNNYNNVTAPKKDYLNIFLKDFLSGFSLALIIAAAIVLFDQLTKITAIRYLRLGESKEFISWLINWTLAYNKGAAWSMCSEHTDVLALVSLFASVIILYLLKDFDIKKKPLYSLALTFILGGCVGNMIDRFFRSDGVVDFIELGFMDFPIFNVADSFLVVGTIILMISVIFFDGFGFKNEKQTEPKEDEESGELND